MYTVDEVERRAKRGPGRVTGNVEGLAVYSEDAAKMVRGGLRGQ